MKVGSDSASAAAAAAAASAAVSSSSTLDLLTDFVQQTQAELGADPLGTQPEVQEQQQADEQQRTEQKARQEQTVAQLDQAIKQAVARGDDALKNVLVKLKDAVLAGPPESPGEEKVLKELINPGKLLHEQDGFGAQKASLPPAIQKAVEYLKAVLENPAAFAPQSAEADLEELAAHEIAHATETGAPSGEAPVEHADPQEKKIKDFVAKYFSEGFETKKPTLDKPLPEKQQAAAQPQQPQATLKTKTGEQPAVAPEAKPALPSPKEALTHLSKDTRPDTPAFARLTPEEQKFVLTADSKQIAAYNQLPQEQKSVFRDLQGHERGPFLKLSADEKKFLQSLAPEEKSYFLSLHPDGRNELRQKSPEARAQIFGDFKKSQAAAKSEAPEKVANQIGKELLSQLGIKPEKKPALLEKARALAYNYLASSKGDLNLAQMGTLKALIAQPEVQRALEKEVASAIKAAIQGPAEDTKEAGESSESAASSETSESSGSRESKPSSFSAANPKGGKASLTGEAKLEVKRDETRGEAKQEQTDHKETFRAREGVNYAAHFQKVRHVLMPEFALKLVQPGVTREQIVEGMKKAVMVSADYAEAHPPRRASARYQQIRRGFHGRQLFG